MLMTLLSSMSVYWINLAKKGEGESQNQFKEGEEKEASQERAGLCSKGSSLHHQKCRDATLWHLDSFCCYFETGSHCLSGWSGTRRALPLEPR